MTVFLLISCVVSDALSNKGMNGLTPGIQLHPVLPDLSRSFPRPSSLLLSQIDIRLLQSLIHAIDFPSSSSRPILMFSSVLLVGVSTSSVP